MNSGLSRLTRAVLAMLLVGAIAGSAIAFSVGVRFTPRQSCDDTTVSYGATCTDDNPQLKKKVKVSVKRRRSQVSFKVRNSSSVRITAKLRAVVQTKSGRTRKVNRTFTVGAGKSVSVTKRIRKVRALKVTVKISDGNGHTATINKKVGKFTKST